LTRGPDIIPIRILLPGGAVLLVAATLLWGGDEGLLAALTEDYSLLLYGVGMALGAFFHRSRVLVGILGIGLLDLFGARIPGGDAYLMAMGGVGLVLLGILVLASDRGVFSWGGVVQLLGAGILVAGPAVAFRDPAVAATFLEGGFLGEAPAPEESPFQTLLGLPPVVLALAGLGALFAAVGLYRRGGPVDRGFAWGFPMVLLAIHPATAAGGSTLFLMAAALTLVLATLETSYKMAYRDELTDLPGRRALMRDLGDVRGTFTAAMVDVDHFKQFNDRHGHEVGDQVLKLVASRLAKAPGGGKAYRYGGEEFTLLYPGKDAEAALPHLEAVRRSVEDARFTLRAWNRPKKKPKGKPRTKGSKKLSVTASIGAADSTGANTSPEAVLKAADEALYRAKKKGRNRVSS
jgi:diguanylate cyclase (GGDEF)-like protein